MGKGCLRLVLGLVSGVGSLKLVGESVVLLAGHQVVELLTKVKQRTEDNSHENNIKDLHNHTLQYK